jgi:phosphoglycolate phosphatase
MAVQLILFDIDGTLLHGKGIGREATRRAMLEVFGTEGTIDGHQFAGKTDWLTLCEVLAGQGYSAEAVGRHLPVYEQSLARHMAELVADYEVVGLPGALEIVTVLRQRADCVLGIVTGNVSTTAPVKLRAAGFDPAWFPVGAYGSEALHRDELPRLALQRAIQHTRWQILPQQVTVIGDTVDDIRCARALGARAVAVTTGFTRREALVAAQPDYLLESLDGLLPILDA